MGLIEGTYKAIQITENAVALGAVAFGGCYIAATVTGIAAVPFGIAGGVAIATSMVFNNVVDVVANKRAMPQSSATFIKACSHIVIGTAMTVALVALGVIGLLGAGILGVITFSSFSSTIIKAVYEKKQEDAARINPNGV